MMCALLISVSHRVLPFLASTAYRLPEKLLGDPSSERVAGCHAGGPAAFEGAVAEKPS